MFFENFYEDIGTFDESILTTFKENLYNLDLSQAYLERIEPCFKDSGKLILPMHFGEVIDIDRHWFSLVSPLINLIEKCNHHSLQNTIPFRVEISIIEPSKRVKWHTDQHILHKFSERIHVPIISNSSVEFISKWITDDRAYMFTMEPGHIYRYNNRVLHAVKNPAGIFRCHVIIDFIKKPIFDYFEKNGLEKLVTNAALVTGADELFYFINRNVTGCTLTDLDQIDIEELENLKSYAENQ